MAKLELNEPFIQTNEPVKPVNIPFLGGSAKISPGGSFIIEGKKVDYNSKVKINCVDSKGQIEPRAFLSMCRAVLQNSEAVKLLESL